MFGGEGKLRYFGTIEKGFLPTNYLYLWGLFG